MSLITVNEKHSFEIEQKGNTLVFQGKEVPLTILEIGKKKFHLLYKNRSFTAEVVTILDKEMMLKINGTEYSVILHDEYEGLLESLGMTRETKNGAAKLNAPMPGLVLNVLVQVGDTVDKGTNLLILEAMKMENIIKSPREGIIKSIEIEKGTKVEKNQALITFE